MCVCLHAYACVYLGFWWVVLWPGGWLSKGGIIPLLRNRGGIGGRFSFRGVPNRFLKSHWIVKTQIEPVD